MARGSSTPPVAASGPKAGKSSGGTLRSVTIEVAEGGYTARCRHDPPASKKGSVSSVSYYDEPKEYVFTDRKALDAFLDKQLGTTGKNED